MTVIFISMEMKAGGLDYIMSGAWRNELGAFLCLLSFIHTHTVLFALALDGPQANSRIFSLPTARPSTRLPPIEFNACWCSGEKSSAYIRCTQGYKWFLVLTVWFLSQLCGPSFGLCGKCSMLPFLFLHFCLKQRHQYFSGI